MNIWFPSDKRSSWVIDLPAGKRNARSSRSTFTSYFCLNSVTSRGVGLFAIADVFFPPGDAKNFLAWGQAAEHYRNSLPRRSNRSRARGGTHGRIPQLINHSWRQLSLAGKRVAGP